MAAEQPPIDPAPAVAEPEPRAGPEVRQGRHWGWYVAKYLGIAVVGVLLLAVAAVLLLDTGPGRRFVADQIAGYEMENGMRIDVGRIDGSLYGEMVLRHVSVKDTRGEFLFSPEVKVDWRPFKFLRNHVDVRSATAQRMNLRRVPAFRATPPSDAPLLPDLDIDIGKLRIDNFIAEAPVSGEVRVARIEGKANIASGRAQVTFNGGTVAGVNRAGGDRIALMIDAVPEANRLDIDLKLNAPQGGVIAALGGLTEPLFLNVSGKGDWKAWNGWLRSNIGTGELANLALKARDGTFTIKGPTQVARLMTGPTASLLGPITNLDLTAKLDDRTANVTGRIYSDAFTLGTNGLVDLSDNTFDQFKLAFVLLKPSALAENLSGSGLRAIMTLDGAFATPRVQYAINADRLVMNDMGLERFTASGDATVDADRVMIPVKASVARITGLDTVAGGTLANVTLAGDVAIDGPRILSDNMRMRSDRIDAKLILLADMEKGLYTGAVNGRIDNYRIESVGIFNIETDIDLRSAGSKGFALEGRVRARSTKLLNPSLQEYLGGNFAASSDVRYGPDGEIRFANLRLEAPDLRVVGGSGSYAPDGRITLNASGVSDRYGRIGVRVAGTISNPRAHVSADRPNLGIGLANLRANITGARGGYRLDLTGDTDYGPLSADVTLGAGKTLTVQINRANLSGVEFTGTLRKTGAGPFSGRLTANGNGLGGVLQLAAQGRYQAVDFNIRANDTVFQGPANLSIGSAIIDGRVVLYNQPYIVADAQIADTTYGTARIAVARGLVNYQGGRGSAKALVEGTAGAPFRVAANADLTPRLWRVMLDGRARGIAFKTASPARIVPKTSGYELLPSRIEVGGGSVKLAGAYGNGIKVQSRMEGVDLSLLNTFSPGLGIGGSATGSLDFAQASPSAFPRADARLQLNNFTRTTAATVSQPVDIAFVGKLLSDGGEARAVFRQRGSVIGRMVASLRPLSPGAGSWTTRLSGAPLSGGIRYNGPAATLFSLAGQTDQSLTGSLGVAADFSCRVSAPCLQGVIRGKDLVYENQTYGTRLAKMALVGRFTGNRLEIETLKAAAGNGTVSATGYVSLAADAGYPMDISVTMQRARLARSSSLAASATGQLRLTKTAGQTALLSGNLVLPETRYQIVREGAAQVPQLTGVRFKPPRGRQRITGEEPVRSVGSVFSLIRLDIDLKAPEELYVSGMGLESEWSADLTVGGTSAAPVLSGEVELIRGTLGFAGKSFELTEGRVSFTGGRIIDPTIRIAASEDIEDVTVNVNVGGRATDPQITFTSVPGLPQDEILSRVLFGSSIANLSAIQAVQLASSLNSLRGSGGGLNPLGKLRSATGIDRLRILGPDDATGRGTALAAGQYLTDDIYVELITDTRGFTATQLEISITSWLSALAQAGGSGVSNVNVRIKKDY